jgi:hypothetical protein
MSLFRKPSPQDEVDATSVLAWLNQELERIPWNQGCENIRVMLPDDLHDLGFSLLEEADYQHQLATLQSIWLPPTRSIAQLREVAELVRVLALKSDALISVYQFQANGERVFWAIPAYGLSFMEGHWGNMEPDESIADLRKYTVEEVFLHPGKNLVRAFVSELWERLRRLPGVDKPAEPIYQDDRSWINHAVDLVVGWCDRTKDADALERVLAVLAAQGQAIMEYLWDRRTASFATLRRIPGAFRQGTTSDDAVVQAVHRINDNLAKAKLTRLARLSISGKRVNLQRHDK